MKEYMKPFLEVILAYTEDIITTSPGQLDNTGEDIDWDDVDAGF